MDEDNELDAWAFDDDDLEEWEEAWAEADRQAVEVLRGAWPALEGVDAPPPTIHDEAEALRAGLAGGSYPFDWFVKAGVTAPAGITADDLWLDALASTISPSDDPGTSAEEQAAVGAMLHADWLAFVLGLVRRGVGATFTAEAALRALSTMDEIEGDPVDEDDVLPSYGMAVEVLAPLWETLGVLDDDRRLTALGEWGLPRALEIVWSDGGEGRPAVERLDPEVEEAALVILARGPVSAEELRRELAKEARIVDLRQLEDALNYSDFTHEFEDGRWAHVPTLAEGVVLTHRLTTAEIDAGALDAGFDLDAWSMAADEGLPMVGGGEIRARYALGGAPMPGESNTAFFGPEGWLAGFTAGDLIGLRYVDRQIGVEKVDSTESMDAEDMAALEQVLAAAIDHDVRHGDADYPGVPGADVVFGLRERRPEAFRRPMPCLSELATDLGYDVRGAYVAAPGTRWHGEPSWFDDEQIDSWRAWESVKRTWRRTKQVPDDVDWADLAHRLRAPVLDMAGLDLAHEPELEPLAEQMERAVTGAALGVPLYLRAKAAEGRGDSRAWLAFLEQAAAADPSGRDALLELADLRSVMGDAREAHRLYLAGGLDTTVDEVAILAEFLQPPAAGTGRNKPCPCGSGRKYKVCHGRTDRHPLPARARWLWRKVEMFGQQPSQRDELLEWAGLLADCHPSEPAAVQKAMSDPTAHDFAIFDGGIFEDFLRVLGPLLPDDELELASRWRDSARRLLEVRSIQPSVGVTVTDLLTDEKLVIRDRLLSRNIEVDDLLLARPLDDGSGDLRLQAGPLSIPRLMRSSVLAALRAEAPAYEIATMLAPRAPEVRTTDGQELVLCEARYELAEPETAWPALNAALEPAPDGALQLLDKNDVVLGSISPQGSRALVQSNAIERFRVLQALVLAADPGARLIDESTQPMATYDAPGSALPGGPAVELSDEDYRAIARQHEDRWLADSIPALGGRTPRQAVAEAREELVALLKDFEVTQRRQPTPFDMDLARIRSELGLT